MAKVFYEKVNPEDPKTEKEKYVYELVTKKIPITLIAESMGLSRQRVSAICYRILQRAKENAKMRV